MNLIIKGFIVKKLNVQILILNALIVDKQIFVSVSNSFGTVFIYFLFFIPLKEKNLSAVIKATNGEVRWSQDLEKDLNIKKLQTKISFFHLTVNKLRSIGTKLLVEFKQLDS